MNHRSLHFYHTAVCDCVASWSVTDYWVPDSELYTWHCDSKVYWESINLKNMQYMMPKGALRQCQPSLRPYFSSFVDLDVCLIYTLSGISEHSSSLGRSALACCSHQSFNSLDLFGAVRWYTVTRVFGNASRSSPPVKSCVSLVCVRSGGVRQS